MTRRGNPDWMREGRAAVYWAWYCSPYRADGKGRSWGRNHIGALGYHHIDNGRGTFGDYPGWRVMHSQPHQRYGVAGGPRGAARKTHMVRDQIVAKHADHPEQRLTRWLCGASTFDAVLLAGPESVCSACLLVAQHRSVEPLP